MPDVIAISKVHGTPDNAASGLTTVEEYLHKTYLREREIETPLANSGYGSKFNLPQMVGQFIKFTRRQKGRFPEKGVEGKDPESGVPVGYEQFRTPIEWIKEWTGVTMEVGATSWLKVADDARTIMMEALRRDLHALVQDAMYVGRYKPFKRNAAGDTVGDADYPHFRQVVEATLTRYGVSFTWDAFPRYFVNGKNSFNQLAPGDQHTMSTYLQAKTRLLNSGVPRINGGLVAVITDSIKHDLTQDDRYFQASIRSASKNDMIFKGQISDYEGIHWIIQDDPFTQAIGGNADAYVEGGEVHVAHMFGQDAFGYMRLGGKDAASPRFKVQDVSKTGSLTTIGYGVPFQAMVLQKQWGANIVGPVRVHENNS